MGTALINRPKTAVFEMEDGNPEALDLETPALPLRNVIDGSRTYEVPIPVLKLSSHYYPPSLPQFRDP